MAAPWMQIDKRRTIKAPVNPMDKSTIISIYPHRIEEKKPTIQPGVFVIEPGTYERPSTLVVGPSSWWKDLDVEQPLLEIPVSSIQIADSVIRDYANGLDGCDMADKMPGLFFLPGTHTADAAKREHKALFDQAAARQKNWFAELVKTADILWARSGGNPICISDDMRLAAKELQLKDKSWMANSTAMELVNCRFCGALVRPGFPVCGQCHHVVNDELYKKLNPVKVA